MNSSLCEEISKAAEEVFKEADCNTGTDIIVRYIILVRNAVGMPDEDSLHLLLSYCNDNDNQSVPGKGVIIARKLKELTTKFYADQKKG